MCCLSNLFCCNRNTRRNCNYLRTRSVDAGGRSSCRCECPCHKERGYCR